MAVFKVETYAIKPEKHVEYMAVMKKCAEYVKKNKQKCKELRSWRLFSQMFGGTAGGYVEIAEFESLADLEIYAQGISWAGKINCRNRLWVHKFGGAWHVLGERVEFRNVS